MKVILRQNFENLGQIGDVVDVKNGYARNFLIPRKFAYAALEGNVRAVNMQKSLVEISIGAANGVKKNMVFHVTRGDKFICDLRIFEVDNDKAVGIPELVQEPPQAGDIISTNL